jgi:hypothetical protein
MAMEVRRWWKESFGFDIYVLEMLGKSSIAQLGAHCAEGLWESWEAEAAASRSTTMRRI